MLSLASGTPTANAVPMLQMTKVTLESWWHRQIGCVHVVGLGAGGAATPDFSNRWSMAQKPETNYILTMRYGSCSDGVKLRFNDHILNFGRHRNLGSIQERGVAPTTSCVISWLGRLPAPSTTGQPSRHLCKDCRRQVCCTLFRWLCVFPGFLASVCFPPLLIIPGRRHRFPRRASTRSMGSGLTGSFVRETLSKNGCCVGIRSERICFSPVNPTSTIHPPL